MFNITLALASEYCDQETTVRIEHPDNDHDDDLPRESTPPSPIKISTTINMASNLPAIFNATQEDIEKLVAAQCHIGSKNIQVRSRRGYRACEVYNTGTKRAED